jgi:hypothetical protein
VLAAIAASCSVPSFQFGQNGAVLPSHCTDLISDQGETGLDCGGTCPACGAGGTCLVNNDCAGAQCVAGLCQNLSCTDGVLSGTETDVDCGGGGCALCATGLACALGRDCASGVCSSRACAPASCSDSLQNGDESDVDCGAACSACLPGQKCRLPGDCAGGDCTNGRCSLSCLDGKGNCDGDAANGCETNLKTDARYCGACDRPCDLAHASARCTGGTCAVDSCSAPFADCDGDPSNGCETNTSTDAGNCNGCGLSCPAINGVPSCVAAACQITCSTGFSDCDDDRSNGCEKKTDGDAANCGACGKVCDAGNGTARCNSGVCGVSDCPAGFGDCDGDPSNGCEVNLSNDANNCNICGSRCEVANNVPSCVASVCKIGTCDANHADCNGVQKDGCETNIASDLSNCGTCGKVCAIGNGTGRCENKLCKVSACGAPWADCDANGTDCETNTNTNASNCGGCGSNGLNCNTVYGALNASGKCLAGGCQFDKCAPNFADCNKDPETDGCEVNLKSASGNCGACGTACQAPHGSNACIAGACTPSCGAAFGDCDGDPKTGCEAVLASDASNCGSCGTVCQPTNGSNVCLAGACSPTCSQAYFQSCDGNKNNGCEADTRSSKANCGGCGKACLDNQTASNNCTASSCVPVCLPNHASCDGNPNNGCETPTAADPANCGGCGVTCKTQNASATTCVNGACSPTCNSGFAACTPSAGCTSIDSVAHCGNCATACSGGTPFCLARACAAHLDIGVVNSGTIGSTTVGGQNVTVAHTLQTSAAANAYRLLVVGITGFGNGSASLPLGVQYNFADMTLAKAIGPVNQVSAAIYYLQGASLPPAAGSYNLVVRSAGTNSFALTANVLELINVEQATGGLDASGGSPQTNACATNHPSDALSVASAGAYLYSVAGVNGSANDASPNSLTGQTITEQSTLSVSGLGTVAGYLKAPGTGLRTVTWVLNSCSASAHALIAIKPAQTP